MSPQSSKCESCKSLGESLFCDLSREALSRINLNKIDQSFRRGQYIFYEGNQPSGLYCISSGVVKVETTNESGNSHILKILQGGDLLGYRSLFASEAYDSSAVAHEDTRVCFIPKTAIMELVKQEPMLALKLIGQLSREVKFTETRLCHATDNSAAERVAEALLFLKQHFQAQTWTRKEIAEWAGYHPRDRHAHPFSVRRRGPRCAQRAPYRDRG
jgi:CRP-like cAMP-binding protein